MQSPAGNQAHSTEILIAGKSMDEWEREWRNVGSLEQDTKLFPTSVGVYRIRQNGSTIYIGRATESTNRGLRKRLTDYTRNSPSSRNAASGRHLNLNAASLTVDIIETGKDEFAELIAQLLESLLIYKHRPPQNKRRRNPGIRSSVARNSDDKAD